MNLEIEKVTVLTGEGPDILILYTKLLEGCWPYDGNATVQLKVGAGGGVNYVNLNMPELSEKMEVINVSGNCVKSVGCGNPECSTSTGICGSITHGHGELDDYGYWEFPCFVCANKARVDDSEYKHWPMP